jgi:hypothetical protein
MKSLVKTFRILNVGFMLGVAFMAWLYNDEIEAGKKTTKEDSNPGKLLGDKEYAASLDDLYNHYLAKEKLKNA